MHTTTDTEAIEAALDACEGVRSAHADEHTHAGIAVDVYFHDEADSVASISDVLDAHDLRIWYVSFDTRLVTLVPASELSYPLGGGDA